MKNLYSHFCWLMLTGTFLFSCNKNKELPMIYIDTPINELVKEALAGDTNAYFQLSNIYYDSPNESFLRTSLLMANKYSYHQAYIDVYYCLTDLPHKKKYTELDDLDVRTRELALVYLKDAVNAGNKEAMEILGHYLIEGKYVPKDVKYGNELLNIVSR